MRKNSGIVLLAFALALVSATAYAQGASSTTSLTGMVVDKDGGVIPGASVVVKNNATGVSQTTITNATGVYSFPTLEPGTYSVTITLQGFKTAEIKEARLLAATPGSIRTVLEIGQLSETVEVKAATDLVRTQTPSVSSTISTEFISTMPRSDRNVLSFLIFLPGVQTSGGAGNSRGSTIAGLPQNTLNISIDGINTGNNLQSTDGFFTLVTPRPDSVEEVTLTTAASGADSSGQGTVQVRFVTRSGTNTFNTSLYDFLRHKSFNSNPFFNAAAGLPRPRATVNQYGGRVGGPIVIPGLFDGHGKAFFFFNQENSWQPNQTGRDRTIARTSAMAGNFTYGSTAAPVTVNVLDLARANGQISATDPAVMAILQKIRSVAESQGTIQAFDATPNTETYNFQVPVASKRYSPTGRVDFNLSPRHRLSGTYWWQRLIDFPDTLNSLDNAFPGFPVTAGQSSFRTTGSANLRSTLGGTVVNEALFGWQWSPIAFFDELNADMYRDPEVDQKGFFMNFGNIGQTLTNPQVNNFANFREIRNTVNYNFVNTLNWLKGDHSYKFGFEFTRITSELTDQTIVPQVNFGLSTAAIGDPALGMFNSTNFPGATTTDLDRARALYALLTGRVASLPGDGFLNAAGTEYVFNGDAVDRERQDELGIYVSDSWRIKPNLTISAGLRYELQFPMVAQVGLLTGSKLQDVCGISGAGNGPGGRQCNLFQPGFVGNPGFTGSVFTPLAEGAKGHNVDYNNFAPSIGANWKPNVQTGWLRKLMGDPEQATISGGYSRTFNRERVDRFRTVFVGNPGSTTPATRGTAAGQFPLVDSGDLPLLFSQTERLVPPNFVRTPSFPLTALQSQSIFIFDENIQVPYTDSWTVGVQRSLDRDTAVEVRYIGNQNKKPWTNENWNGANFRETGLVGVNPIDNVANQFALAQANLRANVAAGLGGTFAFTGIPGTSPLPIFLAHFSAVPIAQAGNPALYTSTQFTNTTWVSRLDPFNPDPQGIATNLWAGSNGAFRANGITSGIYPANFWVLNPAVNGANVTRNLGSSKYNSMQIDVRRRFSRGLAITGSYTYARGTQFSNVDLHLPLLEQRSAGIIPHAIKMLWNWELPFGRGKRFGTNVNKWVDIALGGWQFSGAGRIQVPLFRLSNTRIQGMSFKEAQDLFKQMRIERNPVNNTVTVFNMPQDVIDETIKAFSTNPALPGFFTLGAPTGRYFDRARRPAGFDGPNDPGCDGLFAGDCAPDLFFYGKWFGEYDFKLMKKFNLPGKATFQMDIDLFNALTGINFNQNLNPGSGATIFRSTSAGSAARVGQLSWRVTW